MAETQMVATVLQSQLKSEYEEEESWQSKEDKMTLAQFSQTRRSSSPKAILPLNTLLLISDGYFNGLESGRPLSNVMENPQIWVEQKKLPTVVADNINQAKSCKKVSFADLDETKSSSTDSGRVYSLSAVERAEEIQSRLGPEFPSFVKRMLKSHVSSCFWLGLPTSFCNSNLPKRDAPITLIDENGEESVTKFLAEKNGLSGGWRGFSMAHKLVEEDVLVFQLVKATKFKVYIVRTHCLTEVDGALGLLQLEACGKLNEGKDIKKFRKHTCARSLPQSKKHKTSPPVSDSNLGLTAGQHSENDSDEVDSEVLEGIRFSGSMVDFKDVKNLESFTVMVNGLVIDSEISEHLRTKYYELCCSQNAFLHEHLLEGFNCKLVAGIISETVNIADAIRASKLSTTYNEFSIWDKSLQAFEQLGMNVGFLRSRLKQIMNLAFESEQAVDSERYIEAVTGQVRVQEEIKALEDNLVELRNEAQRFETDIKTLKMNAEKHELMFQAKVNARW